MDRNRRPLRAFVDTVKELYLPTYFYFSQNTDFLFVLIDGILITLFSLFSLIF